MNAPPPLKLGFGEGPWQRGELEQGRGWGPAAHTQGASRRQPAVAAAAQPCVRTCPTDAVISAREKATRRGGLELVPQHYSCFPAAIPTMKATYSIRHII